MRRVQAFALCQRVACLQDRDFLSFLAFREHRFEVAFGRPEVKLSRSLLALGSRFSRPGHEPSFVQERRLFGLVSPGLERDPGLGDRSLGTRDLRARVPARQCLLA